MAAGGWPSAVGGSYVLLLSLQLCSGALVGRALSEACPLALSAANVSDSSSQSAVEGT